MAEKLKTTSTNTYAIIEAILYSKACKKLYKEALFYIEKALALEYSDVLQYYYLYFSYDLDPQNMNLLKPILELSEKSACLESSYLCLSFAYENSLSDIGLECISNFSDEFEKYDLVMFYAKYELYEDGFKLCADVFNYYSMDKYIVSAIIECCTRSGNYEAAEKYSKQIKADIADNHYFDKKSRNEILKCFESDKYRRKCINSYHMSPPRKVVCCYFGCPNHQTNW